MTILGAEDTSRLLSAWSFEDSVASGLRDRAKHHVFGHTFLRSTEDGVPLSVPPTGVARSHPGESPLL